MPSLTHNQIQAELAELDTACPNIDCTVDEMHDERHCFTRCANCNRLGHMAQTCPACQTCGQRSCGCALDDEDPVSDYWPDSDYDPDFCGAVDCEYCNPRSSQDRPEWCEYCGRYCQDANGAPTCFDTVIYGPRSEDIRPEGLGDPDELSPLEQFLDFMATSCEYDWCMRCDEELADCRCHNPLPNFGDGVRSLWPT